MGGSIAWTIRMADGTEHRMKRWTNAMPGNISDDFLLGDPAAFDRAMASYLEMKDDWERNGPNGPFEQNMTNVYAPYPYGLQPSEYGFVVTDFVTKTFISCNEYTNFDNVFISERFLDDSENIRVKKLERAVAEGRVRNFWVWDNTKSAWNKIPPPAATSARDLWEKVKPLVNNEIMVNFDIDLPGDWKLIETNDKKAAFEAVRALGFVITLAEQLVWDEWINPNE